MDEVFGDEMNGHEFSDDGSTENGYEYEESPPLDYPMVDAEETRKRLVQMVCIDEGFPPRLVESPSFWSLSRAMNPNCPLYDFETIKRGCFKYYDEEMIKIEQILRNRDGQISLTVETLRCFESFNVYACVRAHFIDDNWNKKGWVLCVQNLDECVLIDAVLDSIKNWGIGDKILSLTFQGYHYYDPKSFDDEIKSYIQSHKQLELDGKLLQVYCCAYLFKEMVTTAYAEIENIIDKLRRYMNFPLVDQFWNATNLNLKEALDMKSTGEATDWLSDENWKKVEQVHDLVNKVLATAKLIFERKYPILISLNDLREGLNIVSLSPSLFTNEIAQKMLMSLDKYWDDMFLVLAIAAVLDPRCKMIYIKFLSSNTESTPQPTVLEIVCNLYNNYAARQRNPGTVSNDVEDSKVNHFSSHLLDFQEFVHNNTNRAPKSDLDLYLEEPVLSWDDNLDLLGWWRIQSPKYPTLSKMARDILSIQFSVLNSSNVYYNEERSVDQKLLAAGPLLMNALMCTRSWNK